MINQKEKWVIKQNTVTHHGKNRYKWKDDLIWWLDSMRSGKLPQGCVSHSDSIAKLGWVVSEMSIKSSEGWNLMCWFDDVHNQSWCSISFVPHYSFHIALPTLSSPLHLTSPSQSPILHPLDHWMIQKDVPTPKSHQCPTQSSCDSMSWGLGSITRSWPTRIANSTPV